MSAIPPWIRVTESTSTKVSPSTSIGFGTTSSSGCSPSNAFATAFTPSHGRAEWALSPRKTIRAVMLPRHPAWIVLSVGSSSSTSPASYSSGQPSKNAGSALSSGPISSRGKKRKPRSKARPGASAAQCASSIITASPPFMSLAPSPITVSPSRRPGMLPCAGTVSRWPASTTSSRSSERGVVNSTESPSSKARSSGIASAT